MTYEIRDPIRKSEHDDSVQNADVDAEFESVRRDDPEKVPGERFVLDASSVLLGSVSLTARQQQGKVPPLASNLGKGE